VSAADAKPPSGGFMTVPCTDAAASDLDKVRAYIASIEVELTATRSQLTKALDALGA
jgi:hypothetical protein